MPQLDPVLISGNEGIEKPAAEIFLKACERAGVLPEQALHIGDELAWCVFSLQGLSIEGKRELTFGPCSDYNGAKNAGLRALLLRRPGPEGEEAHKEEGEDLTDVRTIESLSEVIDNLNTK